MTNLTVSVLRFSAAFTLFSIEQMEKSLNVVEGDADLTKAMEGLGKTFDSLSDVLVREMGNKNKQTLQSVTKMSKDMVDRTMESMGFMDPREVIKTSSDTLQKTADITADYAGKIAETVDRVKQVTTPMEESKLAGVHAVLPWRR